jgi:hypothetical protein
MRPALALVLILIAAAGCRSKPKPTPPWGAFPPMQTPAPHISQHTQVTIQGDVRHHVILWAPDLTLARALVRAEYFGNRDPQSIVIFRGDKAILVETRQLLSGVKDPPLLPGDIVEVRR